jgi:hypothetical protein
MSVRVPVGMGVVVPCAKIEEVIKLPELQTARDQMKAAQK